MLGTASLHCGILSLIDGIRVTVPVSGVPGTTLRATSDNGANLTTSVVLNAAGNGVIELAPSRSQINSGALVTIAYVLGDKVGGSAVLDLGTLGPLHWWECLLSDVAGPTPPAGAPATDPAAPPADSFAPADTPAPAETPAPTEPAPPTPDGRSRTRTAERSGDGSRLPRARDVGRADPVLRPRPERPGSLSRTPAGSSADPPIAPA